jgi:hypothetical protein
MADPDCPTSPEERLAAICQLFATAVRRHAADRKKTGVLHVSPASAVEIASQNRLTVTPNPTASHPR